MVNESKTVAVIGASPNPGRYSYLAVQLLSEAGHGVYALGRRAGTIGTVPIVTDWPEKIDDLHTVTLYLGAKNQPELYEYILSLKPKRIVFNPGAENPELKQLVRQSGIEVEEACTLVLVKTNQF
ncbi:MAG: CoA-binding protein [Salibacteraceae bacterium]